MKKFMRKPTIRTILAGSVAAFALGAPAAFAQDADPQTNPAVEAETQMQNEVLMQDPVEMPQATEPTQSMGDEVEDAAEDVADAAQEGANEMAETAEEAKDMAEGAAEDAMQQADNAVSDPDVWNPNDVESASKTELAEAGATMYVIPSAANVREGAGLSNGVVKVLDKGAPVTIHETRGNWTRISADGESPAWIYSRLLTPEKANFKTEISASTDAQMADEEAPVQDDMAPEEDETESDDMSYN